MKAFIVALLSFVFLSGCATPEQRAAKKAAAEAAQTAELTRKIHHVWGPQCEALGLETRSDKWKDCVMQLANLDFQREAKEAREEQANREHWGRAMQNFGNTVYGPAATQSRQLPQQPVYQSPKQTYTDCQPNGVGGFNCVSR